MFPELRLADDRIEVTVLPDHGMTVEALRIDGENLLWERPDHVPPPLSRALGPSGAASIESLHDLLIGGWFEMSPHAGLPGELDGAETMLHGEATRLPWNVEHCDATCLAASVRTVRWPLLLRREISIEAGRVCARSEITNEAEADLLVTHGEHPCFDRRLFAGGRLLLDAESSEVLAPLDPRHASAPAGPFQWPLAPARSGGVVDFSAVPEAANGCHDHVAVKLAGPAIVLRSGAGHELALELDLEAHPYVLLWRNFQASSPPGFGAWDVLAIEPTSAPGRSFAEAQASGRARLLGGGESATYRFAIAARRPPG